MRWNIYLEKRVSVPYRDSWETRIQRAVITVIAVDYYHAEEISKKICSSYRKVRIERAIN